MSVTTSPSKAATLARVRALVAGTLKHFPNGNFTLGNTAFTTASLVALLESLADAIAKADAAKASAKDAIAAMREVGGKARPFMLDYVRYLRAMFRGATGILADFGIEPTARKKKTAEEKAAAAVKATSTRKKRGTVGKRKRALIKGDVTGVDLTPVTDAPAPEPPAPPAKS